MVIILVLNNINRNKRFDTVKNILHVLYPPVLEPAALIIWRDHTPYEGRKRLIGSRENCSSASIMNEKECSRIFIRTTQRKDKDKISNERTSFQHKVQNK